MILIQHKWTRKGLKFNVREFTQPLRTAWEHVGNFWYRTMLRLHFEPNAESVYKYKRRTIGHNKKKKEKFGHTTPLVYTGQLQREITTQGAVKSTSKEAKVNLKGPKHLWYRQGQNSPNKPAEITTITQKEAKEITKTLDAKLQAELDLKNAANFAETPVT